MSTRSVTSSASLGNIDRSVNGDKQVDGTCLLHALELFIKREHMTLGVACLSILTPLFAYSLASFLKDVCFALEEIVFPSMGSMGFITLQIVGCFSLWRGGE